MFCPFFMTNQMQNSDLYVILLPLPGIKGCMLKNTNLHRFYAVFMEKMLYLCARKLDVLKL